ncbi:MAG: NADPH-dependent F420 reductase [archaeon]|nr:NADPH-dependent F420 reductase [archaeon]MCP8314334.1 NADPH-dependent F420 reductase [archaeon]
MRIAILGGTGDFGRGLALRWARFHDMIIGSRDENKAKAFAEDYRKEAEKHYRDEMKGSIVGYDNFQAAKISEIIVFSVPHEDLINFTRSLKPFITNDKIIISPIVPLNRDDKCYKYVPYTISETLKKSIVYASAAEVISFELGSKRIVSTFHTMPAKKLCNLKLSLDCDALMASDDIEAVDKVSDLISQIPNLRPIYAGPLDVSRLLEALTALLMNLRHYSKIKEPSIKIV